MSVRIFGLRPSSGVGGGRGKKEREESSSPTGLPTRTAAAGGRQGPPPGGTTLNLRLTCRAWHHLAGQMTSRNRVTHTRGHEVVCVFSSGIRSRMNMDSATFLFGPSSHVLSNVILNVSELMASPGWYVLMWSPSGVSGTL